MRNWIKYRGLQVKIQLVGILVLISEYSLSNYLLTDQLSSGYYDNLSAKQCHDKSLLCSVNDTSLCVTQDEANEVYHLGNWEYSYYFRNAPNSTLYSTLNCGVWVLELRAHIQSVIDGSSQVGVVFHNAIHLI